MATFELDPNAPVRLSETASRRLDTLTDDAIERIANDPFGIHAPSTDDELAAASASRRLRKLRESRNLTQVGLGAALHVPIGTIREWEQGRKKPDAAALALLRIFEREPEAFARAFAIAEPSADKGRPR